MNQFANRLSTDQELARKLAGMTDAQERAALIKAEGYEVKGVSEFMQRIQEDADFMEALSALETMEEKMRFIVESGYYFTKDELADEQERVAEEEFDTLAGARSTECGAIIEGHCGFTCEPEAWKRDSACSGYFKCTWG